MSTTAHTPGEIQGRDEPDRIFRRYVFTDPTVCSSCFCRLKAPESHVRVGSGVLGHDMEPVDSVPEYHDTDRDHYGVMARYPPRTVCGDCGSISGRALDDPLSRRQALRRAETLAERLAEVGEPVNVNLLKHLVAHLKSLEDFSSYDTECFEAATTIAVREARRP